jgi:hypothetical protein
MAKRQAGRFRIFTCSALMAFGIAGCVTETIPPPEIHTTAFVTDEPDPPSVDTHFLSSATTATNDVTPHNAPASPAMAVPAASPPAPPIPALAPPPVIH